MHSHGGKSILEGWEDLNRQVTYCALCPKMCRFSCPAALARPSEALHPTGKASLLLHFLRNHRSIPHDVAEVFYRCTGCLASQTYCEHEIAVYPPLVRARARALAQGTAPKGVGRVLESLKALGNPFGRDLTSALSDAAPAVWVEPEAQILVFAGCATLAYDPGALTDLLKILGVLGIDVVGVLGPGPLCCGGIYLDLGDEEGFRRAAETVYPKIARAKRILTFCPHCTYTFKSQYGWLDPGLGNRVGHVVQFLLEHMPGSHVEHGPLPHPVVYHDPCYLGRYLGLYDPPRELIRKMLPEDACLEFPANRSRAECCGGGSGFALTFEEDARAIARRRLQRLPVETFAMTTSCPWCVGLFRKEWSRGHVLDLVTLLARAIAP